MNTHAPSSRFVALRHLAFAALLFVGAWTHAQPGPGYALRINDTASYVAVPQAVGFC